LAGHEEFERAFGKNWQLRLTGRQKAGMLQKRWSWLVPASPEPHWEKDIPFWTISGSERKLLCDVWQPPDGVEKTGLALLYFHGSDWYLLDKDVGTRPFFRHLAAQGHMVMDVAYRLFPEGSMNDMVGDVKRAIAWMKTHAKEYGVDPDKVVIGGASAGGHLSMLTAFGCDVPEFQYDDVKGMDCTVCGVISEYGPSDLVACYYHTRQDKTTLHRQLRQDFSIPEPQKGSFGFMSKRNSERLGFNKPSDFGSFLNILGGHPGEVSEKYRLYSPMSHVHSGCPPTLLIQGSYDLITTIASTCELHRRLVDCGVPAVNVVFPFTDHAFDLVLPRISPTAQAAWYDIDRFLALMAS
jgi:acetyl esterase/lipase